MEYFGKHLRALGSQNRESGEEEEEKENQSLQALFFHFTQVKDLTLRIKIILGMTRNILICILLGEIRKTIAEV